MRINVFKRFVPFLLVASIACAGSFSKDAFNTVASIKAAYNAANEARDGYCVPLTPKPKICTDSFKPLQDAYTVLTTADGLLATYLDNSAKTTATAKAAAAQAQSDLNALGPKISAATASLTGISGSFVSAPTVTPKGVK